MSKNQEFNLTVVTYDAAYRQQTLSLLRLLWSDLSDEMAEACFSWRYENNPYSSSPLIVICINDGMVVGVLGHMIQKFCINGKQEYACIPVDGIVALDYRRSGAYAKMLEAGVRMIDSLQSKYDFKLYFNASANAKSVRGLINLGWRQLGRKQYRTRFSVFGYLKRKTLSSEQYETAFVFTKRRAEYRFEVSSEIRFKDINGMRSTYVPPIYVIHDDEYIRWRYSYLPNRYRFMYLYKDNQLVSYLVVGDGGSMQCSLDEYNYSELKYLKLILSQFIKLNLKAITRVFFISQNRSEKALFLMLGFITEPQWLLKVIRKERTFVYLRSIKPECTDADYIVNGVDTLCINNWSVFQSDIL